MDNKSLGDMRNRLSALPVLKERLASLEVRIKEAENEVRSLLEEFEKESMDVERLKKDSLSATLLKLLQRYEGRMDRETEEMLSAKLKYDQASARVNELRQQRKDLYERIAVLTQEKQAFDSEMAAREEKVRNGMSGEASIKYNGLEEQRQSLTRQLAENNEALSAANSVLGTISEASRYLDSAEKWATYDVWFDSGILGHMAKYEKLDDAQYFLNRLNSQLKDLQGELKDVNIPVEHGISGIDSTTRTIDFWFDNIFTDLSVRDRIRENKEQLEEIYDRVCGIAGKLENNGHELESDIADLDRQKNELIISL